MTRISRPAAALGVAACTAIALVLRTATLHAGVPYDVDPDAMVLVDQVGLIRADDPGRHGATVWMLYPHLVARLAALLPERVLGDGSLADHLAQASSTIVQVRGVSAALSLLAMPAAYALARRFLARGPALLATLLAAVSLLSTLYAQQARPHAAAAAFALVAVVAALRLARRPAWATCAAAGVALGLAAGTLQSGVAVLAPLCAAWLVRERAGETRALRWLGLPAVLALGAAIAYPLYAHGDPGRGDPSEAGWMGLSLAWAQPQPSVTGGFAHTVRLDAFDGQGFATVGRALVSFETTTTLAALAAGLAALAAAKRARGSGAARSARARDLLVCAAYVVPYVAVIGAYGRTGERFCLQLVPFLAVAAAWAWSRAAARGGAKAAWLLACALVLPPLGACIALERRRAATDAATQLAGWIAEHVAPGTERVLAMPGVDVPLARTPEALALDTGSAFGTPWLRYQRKHANARWDCPRYHLAAAPLLRAADCVAAIEAPLDVLDSTGAELAILLAPSLGRSHTLATRLAEAFQIALRFDGEFLFRAPVGAADALTRPIIGSDLATQWTLWTWELLLHPEALGSTFEVYRAP